MSRWRDSPTLVEWWGFDGVPYREIAEQIGVGHPRAAGLAKDRGFRRGQGKKFGRWTHGPCLGDGCSGKLSPVPVEQLDEDHVCGTCRARQDMPGPVTDVAAERRAWLQRR